MIFKKVIKHFWCIAGLLVLNAKCEDGTMGDVDSLRNRYQPLTTITLGADFVQKSRAKTTAKTTGSSLEL